MTWQNTDRAGSGLEAELRALRRENLGLQRQIALLQAHVSGLETGRVAAELNDTVTELQMRLRLKEQQLHERDQQLAIYAQELTTSLQRARSARWRARAAEQQQWHVERRLLAASRLMIDTLLHALEHKLSGSELHARRVARMAAALAPLLGLDGETTTHLRMAALLHDIGLLVLTETVQPLPAQEHAMAGAALLEGLPDVAAAAPLVRRHHDASVAAFGTAASAMETVQRASTALILAEAFDALVVSRWPRQAPSLAAAVAALAEAAGDEVPPEAAATLLAACDWPLRPLRSNALPELRSSLERLDDHQEADGKHE